ncbi:MAG: three-Cys-motif partner protein TcmP [Solirubrobacteraceae bacterium]
MNDEPLFHEQMSLDSEVAVPVAADTPGPQLKPAASLHDAVVMGASRDHQLVPDDEDSLSRIIQLHSEDKDHYAYYYADIVSQAMTGKFPALAWVELFAGPGRLWVEPRNAYVDGSPVRAMKVRKPYDIYVFNDLDQQCVRALEPRVRIRDNVHVLNEDANAQAVADYLIATIPKRSLIVLYGDPAGLHLHFDTLARLAAHFPHLDLLLNFPVKQIIRALRGEAGRAATPGQTSPADVRKAAAVLGHTDPMSLISSGTNRTWGPTIRTWFENRLRGISYEHFVTQVISLHAKNVAIYDLMIASRNARAVEFFNEAVRRGPDGRYTLFG